MLKAAPPTTNTTVTRIRLQKTGMWLLSSSPVSLMAKPMQNQTMAAMKTVPATRNGQVAGRSLG